MGSATDIGKEGETQHQGYGTRLMKAAEEKARELGKNKVVVISAVGTENITGSLTMRKKVLICKKRNRLIYFQLCMHRVEVFVSVFCDQTIYPLFLLRLFLAGIVQAQLLVHGLILVRFHYLQFWVVRVNQADSMTG